MVGLVRAARCAGVAELHDRRAHTRAGQPLAEAFAVAAGGAGDRRGRGELLRARRCVARNRDRARGDRQTRHRLPEQRRGVGRRAPNVDRHGGGGRRTLAPQWVAAGARIVGGCCRVARRHRRTRADLRTSPYAASRDLRRSLAGVRLGVLSRQLAVLQHGVDHAVLLGLLGRQDLVAVGVLADLLRRPCRCGAPASSPSACASARSPWPGSPGRRTGPG